MNSERRIASLEEISDDSTLLFTVRDGFDETEIVLVRLNGEIAAWRNSCPHWTDVRLDTGSGAEFRGDEIVCTRHGATFESDSGRCTYGPCEGAYLDEVDVTVEEDAVYLTDDDYAFEHLGPKSDRDLSSGRIGFGGN